MKCPKCETEHSLFIDCPICAQIDAAQRSAEAAENLAASANAMRSEREQVSRHKALEGGVRLNFAQMVVIIQSASRESVSDQTTELCVRLKNENRDEFSLDRIEVYRNLFADYIIAFGEKAFSASLALDVVEDFGRKRASTIAQEVGRNAAEDPLFDQAVEVVLRNQKPSIALVQRHLKIGYNRAARMLDAMEQVGLVSAMSTSGQRNIAVGAQERVNANTSPGKVLDRSDYSLFTSAAEQELPAARDQPKFSYWWILFGAVVVAICVFFDANSR